MDQLLEQRRQAKAVQDGKRVEMNNDQPGVDRSMHAILVRTKLELDRAIKVGTALANKLNRVGVLEYDAEDEEDPNELREIIKSMGLPTKDSRGRAEGEWPQLRFYATKL
jgi:hypothetical protein